MQRIIGELLKAEIADKQARSIKYPPAAAGQGAGRSIHRHPGQRAAGPELAVGGFLANQRNAVLIGGTGTGEPSRRRHRAGLHPRWRRGRFFNVVDLVNRLEAEARAGRQGRLADQLARRDLVILDELGYLPFAQTGGQLLFHLVSRLYERTSIIGPPTDLRRAVRLRRRQDDHRAPRSSDAPLRDHRDRKRLLALQESVLKATDPPAARSPRWAHRNLPRAVRRQPRGGRVGPRAGPSYGLPVRPPPCIPGQHCTPIGGQCSTPIDTRKLEALVTMRLEAECRPYAANGRMRKARLLGHGADRPMRGVSRLVMQGPLITAATWSSEMERGRPGRGSSKRPSTRSAQNRRRHLPTVCS